MLNTELANKILDEIETIERWQGDAYQIFDDVGRALFEMKATCLQAKWENDIDGNTGFSSSGDKNKSSKNCTIQE